MENQEDRISSIAGSFGLWQAGVFFLAALVKIPSAWHMLGVLFKAPTVDFWCVQPEELSYLPVEVWINLSHPLVQTNHEVTHRDPCEIYDIGYDEVLVNQNYKYIDVTEVAKNFSNSAPRKPCQKFQYDNSLFHETVVTEWHLVCNRKILVCVSQFFYLFGILVGGLVATLLMPRTGPRWLLLFGASTQIIAGTATAFAPLLEINIALRFTAACGCALMFTAGYTISKDITWGTSRTLVCAFYEWFWSFGVMSLPGLCLLFGTKSWRSLQIAISVPTVPLLVLAFFYLPESPRWLLENGRAEEAERIVRRMAEVNRRKISNAQHFSLQKNPPSIPGSVEPVKNDKSSGSCLSWVALFRGPEKGKIVALHIVWATTIVTYYGALLNVKNLGNNLFLNIVIAGIAEMVGVTLGALIILFKKKEKWTYLGVVMLAGGFSCIASWFLHFDFDPESSKPISYIWWHQLVLVILGMAGRVAVACSLTLLQLCSAEVAPSGQFPITSLSVVTFARMFLLTAPFIGYLANYGECVSLSAFGIITALGGFASLLLDNKNQFSTKVKLKNFGIFSEIWTVEQNYRQPVSQEKEEHFYQNFGYN